jgi:hypothetical protein
MNGIRRNHRRARSAFEARCGLNIKSGSGALLGVCVYPSAASFRKTVPAASARYCADVSNEISHSYPERVILLIHKTLFDVRWLFLLCRLFSFNMRLASSSAIKLPFPFDIYATRASRRSKLSKKCALSAALRALVKNRSFSMAPIDFLDRGLEKKAQQGEIKIYQFHSRILHRVNFAARGKIFCCWQTAVYKFFYFAFWQGAEIKRLRLVVPVRIRSQVGLIDSNYEELAWRITRGAFLRRYSSRN